MDVKQIIDDYFNSWLQKDRERARSFQSDGLKFRTPQDSFDSADDMMNACWHLAENMNDFDLLHSVYAEDSAYIVYKTGNVVIGELIKLEDGKIAEVYVTFNPTH